MSVPSRGLYEYCQDALCSKCGSDLYRSNYGDCKRKCVVESKTDIDACCKTTCGSNTTCLDNCFPVVPLPPPVVPEGDVLADDAKDSLYSKTMGVIILSLLCLFIILILVILR
jgi:hypothetical protein